MRNQSSFSFFLTTLFVVMVIMALTEITVHSAVRSGGTTTRVSVASDGTQGNHLSSSPSINADGRYIAFSSWADNLVANDTNGYTDIFVKERQTGMIMRVSVASNGTQGNHYSRTPSISADGQYVAFDSSANNMVPNDTNGKSDVFLHDTQSGITRRVSIASDGTEGNGESRYAAISADGRYVTFQSEASNLSAGDTNGVRDVFVHDLQTGVTSRVSVASDGTEGNNHSGYETSAISSEGRYVAFQSDASNLVANDTNGVGDIFVHDRQTGLISRVSIASDGTQGTSDCFVSSISADGRYIVFATWGSNLVPDDTNGRSDVFLHDRETGITSRVSVASDGTEGDGGSYVPVISADGRYTTFLSEASNLVANDTNAVADLFLKDLQTGAIDRISVASDGTQGNDHAGRSVISADGRYAAFDSWGSNLVPDDTNGLIDVFVRDRGELPSPTSTPTHTPTITNTPPPGATLTPTPTSTLTPTPTPTLTVTSTPSSTSTPTPTLTPTLPSENDTVFIPLILQQSVSPTHAPCGPMDDNEAKNTLLFC